MEPRARCKRSPRWRWGGVPARSRLVPVIAAIAGRVDPIRLVSHVVVVIGLVLLLVKRILDSDGGGRSTGDSGGVSGGRAFGHLFASLLPVLEAAANHGEQGRWSQWGVARHD
jgi:hypothetical protein